MKYLLPILCLFIFSCDSGGDDAVEVEGCTNINATNFNTNATIDDGSCTVHGCLDSQACNYDSTATIDNNSCDYTLNEFGCCNDLIKDCTGECGGTAEIDICGVCGIETEINNCSIFGHWQYAYSEDYNSPNLPPNLDENSNNGNGIFHIRILHLLQMLICILKWVCLHYLLIFYFLVM